jgi:L-asparagine transporter-like permease
MVSYTSLAGALLVAAILATTWWVEGMRAALISGVPWLVLLSLGYGGLRMRQRADRHVRG